MFYIFVLYFFFLMCSLIERLGSRAETVAGEPHQLLSRGWYAYRSFFN